MQNAGEKRAHGTRLFLRRHLLGYFPTSPGHLTDHERRRAASEAEAFGTRCLVVVCGRDVSMAVPSIICRWRGGSEGEIWRGRAVTNVAGRQAGVSLAAPRPMGGSNTEKGSQAGPKVLGLRLQRVRGATSKCVLSKDMCRDE